MLGVDHCRDAPFALCLGYGVEGQGGLTRRFRTVDFHDAPFRVTAHAQGVVQADRAGGDHIHLLHGLVAEFHDGAAAIVLFYVAQGLGQGVGLGLLGVKLVGGFLYGCFFWCCHVCIVFFDFSFLCDANLRHLMGNIAAHAG